MYECITEYDEEKAFAEFKEEVTLEIALKMIKLGTISNEDIAAVTGYTVERIHQLAEQNNI